MIAAGTHQRFHYRTLAELRADLDRLGLDLPMAEDLSCLAEPVRIGALTAPNRFAVHPMEGFDADLDGTPGELTFRRYRRYAEGGAGLIWFEATAVLREARSNPHQLFIHERNAGVYRRLVEETRRAAQERHGRAPVLVLQLTHSGRYSKPEGEPEPMIAHHSPILDPLHALPADYPLVADDYLDRLQDVFVAAAKLAAEAGFDGVDIKSCHRYLLSELLASYTREGKYGGGFENRTRMLRETMARVAAAAPGIFVTVRLNVYDGIPYPYGFGVDKDDAGRPDPTEPIALIGALRRIGIPVLNVTIGNPYYIPHLNRPFDFPVQGAPVPAEHPLQGVARFLGITRIIQQAFPDLPVIGTGYTWLRQFMPFVAAGVIRTGGAAMIGQGRGSFAYPDAVRDILEGRGMNPAKVCVTCSACTQIMRDGAMTGCVVRDGQIYGPQYRLGRRHAPDRLREEARRCRACQEPTCVMACPAGIDIPAFLKTFADGDIKAAYGILRRNNVLPEMCGRVCPAADLCQGGCVEKNFSGRPVAIQDVQLAAARAARRMGMAGVELPIRVSGRNIAVAGGGPAGLACAIKLIEAGHMVTVFEKGDRLGGTPELIIPAARYVDAGEEIEALLAPARRSGRLIVACGRELGKDFSLAELRGKYDAVCLATGLTAPPAPRDCEGVLDALTFLARAKSGGIKDLPQSVAVLGGGNTAADAALTAARLGARDVYLIYRRSYPEMPAWEDERAELLAVGIHLLLLTQPMGYVTGAGGRLTGLRIARTVLGGPDSSGRRAPEIVPGSESILPVGMAVEALGQTVSGSLTTALGELVEGGRVRVDSDTCAAKIPGIFACGDLINGGETVVRAVAEGMRAARGIEAYLGGSDK